MNDASKLRRLFPLNRYLFITSALTAAIVAGMLWIGANITTQGQWVRHSLLVRDQLTQMLILTRRAESSQRGFLLTGRDIYLAPYQAASGQLPSLLANTGELVQDNPAQTAALKELGDLIGRKLAELQATVDDAVAGRRDAAMAAVNTDAGMKLMEAIQSQIAAMTATEEQLVADRRAKAARSISLIQIGSIVVFVLICAMAAMIGFLTRRSFRELTQAHDQLALANQKLQEEAQQREQIEAQFRQAQKMEAVGQLTGGIAHDFNNMLQVITSSLQIVRRRAGNGEMGVDKFLEAAAAATDRAKTLTHRLLAFARKQPLEPAAVDPNKLIAGMSDLLRSSLGERVQIELVAAAGLWNVKADTHQLESAMVNIAINARDAMPDGGKLTIETGNAFLDDAYARQHTEVEPGQYAMIAITDTGRGMPPEVAARAFDPFFTTKPPGMGTGLGLSQVYGFIKQSRGHINIYSEVGSGTTVKIYLPRLIGEPDTARPEASQKTRPGDTGDVVLVVEDDFLVRQLSTESLRELGYTVLECSSAAKALATLEKHPEVKLLFTDVVMPEVNGKALADAALKLRPELKVLFTTGYTTNAVVHGGVLDPGVNLLSKPFSLQQLAAKVRAVLDHP
jgi:signal transduction histidine kinase